LLVFSGLPDASEAATRPPRRRQKVRACGIEMMLLIQQAAVLSRVELPRLS
jgi:hypothetical protein